MGRKEEGERSTQTNMLLAVPNAMFPLAIRQDPFLNSQHGKALSMSPGSEVGNSLSTWCNLFEWIYPEQSAQSCLQIFPLCISSTHTVSILSSLNARQLLHAIYSAAYLITTYLITPALCISEIPFTSMRRWPHLQSQPPTLLTGASRGCWHVALPLLTASIIASTAQPQRLLSAWQCSALRWPQGAGASPELCMFARTTGR